MRVCGMKKGAFYAPFNATRMLHVSIHFRLMDDLAEDLLKIIKFFCNKRGQCVILFMYHSGR